MSATPFEGVSAALGEVRPQLLRALEALVDRSYLHPLDPKLWTIAESSPARRPMFARLLQMPELGEAETQSAVHRSVVAFHQLGQPVVSSLESSGGVADVQLGSVDAETIGSHHSVLRCRLAGIRFAAPRSAAKVALGHDQMPWKHTWVVSGTPPAEASWRGTVADIIEAAPEGRYRIVTVAEPVARLEVEVAIDRCLRVLELVHSCVRVSRTSTQSVSESVGKSVLLPNSAATASSGASAFGGLFQILASMRTLPFSPGDAIALFSGINALLGGFQTIAHQKQETETRTRTEGTSTGVTVNLLDATAERLEAVLRQMVDRLDGARHSGLWRTVTYIGADSVRIGTLVHAALVSSLADSRSVEPLRLLPVGWEGRRDLWTSLPIYSLTLRSGGGHPLGSFWDLLGTCLSSEELARLVCLPSREVPGVVVRSRPSVSLNPPPVSEGGSVTLGELSVGGRALGPYEISSSMLNRHVFVTGMTGYGKSNTCKHLLLQAWSKLKTPFLVIEPAKREYRDLLGHAALHAGGVRLYAPGDPLSAPLRLNPFDWCGSTPLQRHIGLLKAALSAVFHATDSPLPFLIDEGIHELYRERGWNLETSTNSFVESGRALRHDMLPTIEDLYRKLTRLVDRRSYSADVRGNLLAAINLRLGTLISGTKGLILNTRRSTPAFELFERPTVIELSRLGDDLDKAFVMAILFAWLYEHAEYRASRRPPDVQERLEHITLIEEAHRLLRAPSPGAAPDASSRAVAMFADMLAEMRAYGEGFIIAEQIPSKLTTDVLKNTGTKLVHRLSSYDDREVVGQTIGIRPGETELLNTVEPGEVLTMGTSPKPIQMRIPLVQCAPMSSVALGRSASLESWLLRDAACNGCASPCRFHSDVEQSLDSVRMPETPRSSTRTPFGRVEPRGAEWRTDRAGCVVKFLRELARSDENGLRDAFDAWRCLVEPSFERRGSSWPSFRSESLHCAFARDVRDLLAQRVIENSGTDELPEAVLGVVAAKERVAEAIACVLRGATLGATARAEQIDLVVKRLDKSVTSAN